MRVSPRAHRSPGKPLPHFGAPPPWQPSEQFAAIWLVRSALIRKSTLGGGFLAIGESNVPWAKTARSEKIKAAAASRNARGLIFGSRFFTIASFSMLRATREHRHCFPMGAQGRNATSHWFADGRVCD